MCFLPTQVLASAETVMKVEVNYLAHYHRHRGR